MLDQRRIIYFHHGKRAHLITNIYKAAVVVCDIYQMRIIIS